MHFAAHLCGMVCLYRSLSLRWDVLTVLKDEPNQMWRIIQQRRSGSAWRDSGLFIFNPTRPLENVDHSTEQLRTCFKQTRFWFGMMSNGQSWETCHVPDAWVLIKMNKLNKWNSFSYSKLLVGSGLGGYIALKHHLKYFSHSESSFEMLLVQFTKEHNTTELHVLPRRHMWPAQRPTNPTHRVWQKASREDAEESGCYSNIILVVFFCCLVEG